MWEHEFWVLRQRNLIQWQNLHVEASESFWDACAVSQVRDVGQQNQRVSAKPLQRAGDGKHSQQSLVIVLGRLVRHHHERPPLRGNAMCLRLLSLLGTDATAAAARPVSCGDGRGGRCCRGDGRLGGGGLGGRASVGLVGGDVAHQPQVLLYLLKLLQEHLLLLRLDVAPLLSIVERQLLGRPALLQLLLQLLQLVLQLPHQLPLSVQWRLWMQQVWRAEEDQQRCHAASDDDACHGEYTPHAVASARTRYAW
mmetsp:Transcript_111522/g.315760  ORF Transcript_111522/g.315760 Transcript_111522/m.315760 type:complete len:253 (+) Transcript_111522:865-1623(+)